VFDADSHISIRPRDHELVIHSTDNARVAWADIVLREDAFNSVSWKAFETGLDLSRVAAITHKVIDTSPTSVIIDERNPQLNLISAGLTLNQADVFSPYVPEVIDPPEYERPAEVILPSGTLTPVIELADDLSTSLRIGVDCQERTFYASAEGDEDSIRLELERSDVVGLHTADVESVFNLKYLSRISNILPRDTNIRLTLGDMVPAVIHYSIAGGNGSVRFTLRPIVRAL
jgi:hypothetical protein